MKKYQVLIFVFRFSLISLNLNVCPILKNVFTLKRPSLITKIWTISLKKKQFDGIGSWICSWSVSVPSERCTFVFVYLNEVWVIALEWPRQVLLNANQNVVKQIYKQKVITLIYGSKIDYWYFSYYHLFNINMYCCISVN